MAASNKDSALKTVDIAPDGDVVFIVGPTQRRMRVQSLFVKTASPVLNAMLRPNFKEGHRLAQTGSAEIELPEDDADAIETILNIIHGRNDKVPDTLGPDELLQVAIAVDKYDCLVSLSFAIRVWIGREGVEKPEGLWALALAACLFRDEGGFAKATSALVVNYARSYIDLARKCEAAMDPVMLLTTAAMLEETRNKVRMMLLMDMLDCDVSGSKKREHQVGCCTDMVRHAGHVGNRSVSNMVETLRQSGHLRTLEDMDGPFDFLHQMVRFVESMSDRFVENKYGQARRLCMWCVRKGEDHKKHSSE
ncbi:hypothetical protein B0I37DRAFT_382490 [Chaetomium sp. MPI-CAGE-AT-0009]|nr:hypothetical protein B0I37DRAFT_382490 [Chaetomium sp. MPI-CAGE-AT-0009]